MIGFIYKMCELYINIKIIIFNFAERSEIKKVNEHDNDMGLEVFCKPVRKPHSKTQLTRKR